MDYKSINQRGVGKYGGKEAARSGMFTSYLDAFAAPYVGYWDSVNKTGGYAFGSGRSASASWCRMDFVTSTFGCDREW